MIVFDNVTLRYHYDDFDLLREVSFTLDKGVNTILADVHSGKSSLCKLLLKAVAPTSGRILIDGQDIASITNANLDILYLPSNPVFFERRSVQYNMEYPLKVRKVERSFRRQRANELCNQYGIDPLAKVRSLGDEQRRVLALARGMTVPRKTALFDGYFDGATDLQQVAGVTQLFDVSVVLTSDVRLARGHVVVLDGGTVVYEGDAEQAQECVSNLYWLSKE